MSAPPRRSTLSSMDLDAYTLITDGRRLYALWADGTLLPVARGGTDAAGTGGGGGGDAGSDGNSSGAAGTGGSGDTGTGGDSGAGDANQADQDSDSGADKAKTVTMTQAELDDLITKAKAKAKKAAEDDAKTAADRAKMDEAERLKAEKADADKATAAAKREALEAKVEVAAERHALAADVDPKRVARFLKVADLTDLEALTQDGAPDEKAIKRAVADAVKEWPEFKTNGDGGKGRSGADMNGDGGKTKAATLEDAVAARYAT